MQNVIKWAACGLSLESVPHSGVFFLCLKIFFIQKDKKYNNEWRMLFYKLHLVYHYGGCSIWAGSCHAR
jgi:hypothetical protein